MATLQIFTEFLGKLARKKPQTTAHQTGIVKLKMVFIHLILKSKDGVVLYYYKNVLWQKSMNCFIFIYMHKYCFVDSFHHCGCAVIGIKNPTGTHVCLSMHAQKYVCPFYCVLAPYLSFLRGQYPV